MFNVFNKGEMPPVKAFLTGPALLSSATPTGSGTAPIIGVITNGRNGSATTTPSACQNPILKSAVSIVKPSNLPKPIIITPNQIRNSSKNMDNLIITTVPSSNLPTGSIKSIFTAISTPTHAVIPITTTVPVIDSVVITTAIPATSSTPIVPHDVPATSISSIVRFDIPTTDDVVESVIANRPSLITTNVNNNNIRETVEVGHESTAVIVTVNDFNINGKNNGQNNGKNNDVIIDNNNNDNSNNNSCNNNDNNNNNNHDNNSSNTSNNYDNNDNVDKTSIKSLLPGKLYHPLSTVNTISKNKSDQELRSKTESELTVHSQLSSDSGPGSGSGFLSDSDHAGDILGGNPMETDERFNQSISGQNLGQGSVQKRLISSALSISILPFALSNSQIYEPPNTSSYINIASDDNSVDYIDNIINQRSFENDKENNNKNYASINKSENSSIIKLTFQDQETENEKKETIEIRNFEKENEIEIPKISSSSQLFPTLSCSQNTTLSLSSPLDLSSRVNRSKDPLRTQSLRTSGTQILNQQLFRRFSSGEIISDTTLNNFNNFNGLIHNDKLNNIGTPSKDKDKEKDKKIKEKPKDFNELLKERTAGVRGARYPLIHILDIDHFHCVSQIHFLH